MMRQATIAINGSILDEKPTGVGVYSFNLTKHLSSLLLDENKKLTVFTSVNFLINKNLKVIKVSKFLQSSKYGKIAAFYRIFWNTFNYPIHARKFDLLISPSTHGSFLLKNQIITIHDLLSLRYNNISFHQRIYFKYLLQLLIKRAKLIVAISENTKRDIIHFFNCPEGKIKVIHNGYDADFYFPLKQKENIIDKEYGYSNYLLAIGPTYPHKNFEIIINAYADLDEVYRQRHPLIIAGGKNKYLEHLQKYIKAMSLENDIHFLGYVPIKFMPSLYREALALIFPSIYEGFGIPPLEAMASGCPVLVSNTSSIPEVCGDAAIYFDPVDKESITLSIKEINTSNKIRNEFIQRGIIQSKKFPGKKWLNLLIQ